MDNKYIVVVSSLIEEYKKTINRNEKIKKIIFGKSARMQHKLSIALLYLRLECLETLKQFLEGTLSDYSRLKELLGTLASLHKSACFIFLYFKA